MPLRGFIEAHHIFPEGRFVATNVRLTEAKTNHKCVDCKHCERLQNCTYPYHCKIANMLMPPEVARKPFDCPDWKRKKKRGESVE
jgi:hypothetical protein